MEEEWKNYGNFKGQIKKDVKLISVKNRTYKIKFFASNLPSS